MHALAEGFRSNVVFDAEQNVAGLAVGDAVEHLLDFGGSIGAGANGAGGGLRIEVQGAVHAGGDNLIDVPFGMHGFNGLVLHPRSEAFVEPDVVPPLHGDEIAEPLMRHFVCDDEGDSSLGVDGCCFGIDEQRGFAIGDGAEVFHGAGFEVGQADEVELLERIGNAEVGVVVVKHVLGDIYTVGGESDLVGRGAGADGDAVLLAGGALKVADEEGHEIRGHLRRGEELESVLVCAGAGRVADDGAVGDSGVAAVDDERDVVGGLEGGLVEGGKGTARVGGFKLGDGVVAASSLGEIEAAKFAIQDAGVFDC